MLNITSDFDGFTSSTQVLDAKSHGKRINLKLFFNQSQVVY